MFLELLIMSCVSLFSLVVVIVIVISLYTVEYIGYLVYGCIIPPVNPYFCGCDFFSPQYVLPRILSQKCID